MTHATAVPVQEIVTALHVPGHTWNLLSLLYLNKNPWTVNISIHDKHAKQITPNNPSHSSYTTLFLMSTSLSFLPSSSSWFTAWNSLLLSMGTIMGSLFFFLTRELGWRLYRTYGTLSKTLSALSWSIFRLVYHCLPLQYVDCAWLQTDFVLVRSWLFKQQNAAHAFAL